MPRGRVPLKVLMPIFQKKQRGFTIIELLIVIVIIAILAAITLVAYNSIQSRAQSSAVQSDLENAKKKLMLYQVDWGSYPSTGAAMVAVGIQATKSAYDTTGNNFYYCLNKVTGEFAIGSRIISKTAGYIISSIGGLQSLSGVGADTVCQAVGLTGYQDTNAWNLTGYAPSTGWAGWVN